MNQTILVIGAMVLLSIAVLSANRIILDRATTGYDSQAAFGAVPLAAAKLDEIKLKAFDEKAIAKKIYVSSDFTPVVNLGKDAGETLTTQYDDIDDYQGDSLFVSTPVLDNFWISSHIEYVQESNPDVVSTVPTFFKRIRVSVYQQSMRYPITMNALYVYRRYQ